MGFKKLLRFVHFSNLIIIPIRRVSMVYFDSEVLNRLQEYYSEQPPNLSKIYAIEHLLFKKIISIIRIEETDSLPQEKHYQFRLCPFGKVLGNVFFSVNSEKEMKRIRTFYDNFYDHKFKIIMAAEDSSVVNCTNKLMDIIETFVSPMYKPKTNERVKEFITNHHISNLDELLMCVSPLQPPNISSSETTENTEIVESEKEKDDTDLIDIDFFVKYDTDPEIDQRAKELKEYLKQYGTKIGKDELNNDTASNQS